MSISPETRNDLLAQAATLGASTADAAQQVASVMTETAHDLWSDREAAWRLRALAMWVRLDPMEFGRIVAERLTTDADGREEMG